MNLQQLAIQLEERRMQLGMSCAVLAHRARLGLRTVQRALSDEESVTPEFGTLNRIADALGASIQLEMRGRDIDDFKQQQAERKAARLVSLTQGTSGLEAQAVPKRTLTGMKKRTARKLVC